jgi:hypothetical protein
MKEIIGPNVKKLIIHKMSLDAIPPGGGVADGLKFFTDKERISKTIRESDEWVKQALLAVRNAGEPNPFKNATDEDIAGEILRKIEDKRNDRKKSLSKY